MNRGIKDGAYKMLIIGGVRYWGHARMHKCSLAQSNNSTWMWLHRRI